MQYTIFFLAAIAAAQDATRTVSSFTGMTASAIASPATGSATGSATSGFTETASFTAITGSVMSAFSTISSGVPGIVATATSSQAMFTATSALGTTASSSPTTSDPFFSPIPSGVPTLADVLGNAEDLSTFNELLSSPDFAELAERLAITSDITILAPTNAAIAQFLQTADGERFQTDPTFAEAVLRYHILNGTMPISTIDSDEAGPTVVNTALSTFNITTVTGGQLVLLKVDDDGDDATYISGFGQQSVVVGEVSPSSKILTPYGTDADAGHRLRSWHRASHLHGLTSSRTT